MEFTTHAVNWIEIPVADFDRAKRFYQAIFDYEMPVMEMTGVRMGFLLYNQQENGVGAAICAGEWYKPSTDGAKVYLNGGTDLNTVLNRVTAAGGTITLPKTQISPEHGYMAFFLDSEGNSVGLHSMN